MFSKNLSITELNLEEAKQYIGGVVFVAIIMAVGFVGNLHVLLVYAFRMKPSNHRIFILVLGVLDFITCIVGMPFIIVDLRNPLTFTISPACKILRFINYFICSASALTLLVIATDRYRKICVPLGRQISQRMAKMLCLLVLFIALLISWPAPVLYGLATVQTSDPNINGTRCYTEDKENFAKYQGYFNALLILIVVVCFIVLVVLYTLIWRVIVKHSGQKGQAITDRPEESSSNVQVTNNTTDTFEMTSGTVNSSGSDTEEKVARQFLPPEKQVYVVDKHSHCEDDKNKGKKTGKSKKAQRHHQQSSDRSRKTTFMFLAITVVFFMSYVPHLILKIVTFMNKSFVPQMSFTEKVVYNTFIWCFFINNMANSFIYGVFDSRFKSEVKNMYSNLYRLARLRVYR
ncbi:5-hydroxytryptamine receptor-like [Mercenaria mercenaria]|uniref:5-hydroxytryptamine receptor-like n=1 Tax=Mercenaria mercenaria TaxID=6596 RepID=UPI00234E937B|nr:5-hydroxytryptamine receptor-like [Mercenaria mercenaria]